MVSKHTKTDGDRALAERNGGEETAMAEIDPNLTLAALVPRDFVETDIGFPPYWKAELGKGFRGIVCMRDERDPDFVRYHIENTGPSLDCQKGPVDDGVVETVTPGRIFTIGAFGALPLERFYGVEVVVIVVGSRKLPGNARSKNVPRDMWEFKVFVSKDVEALLRSKRDDDAKHLQQIQISARRKALEEIAVINAKKLEERKAEDRRLTA